LVALTEIAANDNFELPRGHTLDNLTALLHSYETRTGSSGIADWVRWRDDYLNRPPTNEEVLKVAAAANGRSRGLFHLSRVSDLNLALTQRAADEAVRRGLITKVGLKWVAAYPTTQGPLELAQLIAQLS
jgi:hypothetical protein